MKRVLNVSMFLLLLIFIKCDHKGKRVEKSPIFTIDEITISEIVRGSEDSPWPSFCDMYCNLTIQNNSEPPIILKANENRRVINCYFIYENAVFQLKTSFYLNDTLSIGESKSFHANIPGRELQTVFSQTNNCDSLLISLILEKGSFFFIQNNTDTIWSERSKKYNIRFDDDSF